MNVFEQAIKMELDGEAYYREQAKVNKGNNLYPVFLLLAEDEKNHAKVLHNKFNQLSYSLKENPMLDSKNIFSRIGDLKSDIKENPDQLDAYKLALKKEKESIDLYQEALSQAKDSEEKELFQYLIDQENSHFEILEELILLLNRPDNWVESAEFGTREEY